MALTLNTKTYTFSGITNAIASYVERSLGIAGLFSTVTASLRIDTMVRGQWKMVLPVPFGENDAPCCDSGPVRGVSDANIQFRLPAGATEADRTDFALRLKDLVASPEFQASIINLEMPNS